jgi:predicted RecB family endonuclease
VQFEVGYWRERDDEVDFVVRGGQTTWAIEVKSGRPRHAAGLDAFRRLVPDARPLILGRGGLPLADFFSSHPADLLRSLR